MNRRLKILLRVLLCALAMAAVPIAAAQPKVSGKISGGFEAPTSTDDQGRRHVLTGSTAQSRGKDLYELTDPRVTSYDAQDAPEMFIEAPRCFYEMKENHAYSDATLSVRTADGKFTLEGLGWRWNPQAGNLVISNNVVALVQKAALATNLAARLPDSSQQSTSNAPVRITAASFVQESDRASFIGDVLVQDGSDTLRCKRLNLTFVKPGGVQVIEAVEAVELKQRATAVRSGRASYNLKDNIIRISEKPQWESEGRSGLADTFILDRANGKIFAEGNVFMKLPLTNVTDIADTVATNRFLQVYSDRFRFEERTSNRLASAYYDGHVRAIYTDATISSDAITVGFNATNRVERIIAENEVVIDSRGSKAFGKRAEYSIDDDKIVLTGDPRWELDRGSGKSESLIFYPKTKEALALRNVEMIMEAQSVGGVLGVEAKTNHSTAATPMVIRAETFSRGTNVAVFHGNVVVADARGRLSSDMLTLGFGATNQLQRIIAEGFVRIEQEGLIATGERADYNAATGLVHLTGDPILIAKDKTLRAPAFIIDRVNNTFSVAPGRYRIEMKMKEGSQPLNLSPIKR